MKMAETIVSVHSSHHTPPKRLVWAVSFDLTTDMQVFIVEVFARNFPSVRLNIWLESC
jgi:hypothetical protein